MVHNTNRARGCLRVLGCLVDALDVAPYTRAPCIRHAPSRARPSVHYCPSCEVIVDAVVAVGLCFILGGRVRPGDLGSTVRGVFPSGPRTYACSTHHHMQMVRWRNGPHTPHPRSQLSVVVVSMMVKAHLNSSRTLRLVYAEDSRPFTCGPRCWCWFVHSSEDTHRSRGRWSWPRSFGFPSRLASRSPR